jgi:hypothetical protein
MAEPLEGRHSAFIAANFCPRQHLTDAYTDQIGRVGLDVEFSRHLAADCPCRALPYPFLPQIHLGEHFNQWRK